MKGVKKYERKEGRVGRGGVELCPTVVLPGFYMMDLYLNARVRSCCLTTCVHKFM